MRSQLEQFLNARLLRKLIILLKYTPLIFNQLNLNHIHKLISQIPCTGNQLLNNHNIIYKIFCVPCLGLPLRRVWITGSTDNNSRLMVLHKL